MRQVGVLAAPGLIALRDGASGMIERLAEDHANARRLAEGLAELPGITGLDPSRVRTNFVLFRLAGDEGPGKEAARARRRRREAFLAALQRDGVLLVEYPEGQIRAVTHYGIDRTDIDDVLAAVPGALQAAGLADTRVAVA
jgi:threonine aldolase